MRLPPRISTLEWSYTPEDVARRWPAHRPLFWLHSGRMHPRWARWSILTTPCAVYFCDSRSRLHGERSNLLENVRLRNNPILDLDAVLASTALDTSVMFDGTMPFHGGWIGYFSYDFGGVLEPRSAWPSARTSSDAQSDWPLIELAWCPDAVIYDHACQVWHVIGDPPWLDELREEAVHDACSIGELHACIQPSEYRAMVARAIEYIAAGDIFQANLAQRFEATFSGSTRILAVDAFMSAQPWYGAYLELNGGRTLLSLSPELFLQTCPLTRRVISRPIKGTRPAQCDPNQLAVSVKDRAELAMIVDLMRNDLGRVCEIGSIHVPVQRAIESHPTVHHGVAEVTGCLRSDVRLRDLLSAAFPPGSVTGAPKIRAMQIINELERTLIGSRGPYCGAVGFISDSGATTLNVAIRTMMLSGRRQKDDPGFFEDCRLTYFAGAGIVADSDPHAEFAETLDKTAIVRALACPAAQPVGTLDRP